MVHRLRVKGVAVVCRLIQSSDRVAPRVATPAMSRSNERVHIDRIRALLIDGLLTSHVVWQVRIHVVLCLYFDLPPRASK